MVNKMIKKILIAILVMMLVVGLTGCVDEQTTNPNVKTQAQLAQEEELDGALAMMQDPNINTNPEGL